MTRSQHEATRALEQSMAEWLRSYGWRQDGQSWVHSNAPHVGSRVNLWDAFMLTRATPLRYGAAR